MKNSPSKIRLASRLIKIARMLVAFNRNELEEQLKKKRSDLNEASLKEHLDCLDEMDARRSCANMWSAGRQYHYLQCTGRYHF